MYAVSVLDRKILGFLDDGPLHGYELRRRITELDGPGARLSEGALYPALARLERAGLITRTARTSTSGRIRRILTITDAGRERLHELLRSPAREEMEAMPAFLGVLMAVAVTHWPSITRIVRAEVIQIRTRQYILASRKFGLSMFRVAKDHI